MYKEKKYDNNEMQNAYVMRKQNVHSNVDMYMLHNKNVCTEHSC